MSGSRKVDKLSTFQVTPKVKEITELVLNLSTSLGSNMTVYETRERQVKSDLDAAKRQFPAISTSPVSMRVCVTLTKSVINIGAKRLCNTL